MTYSYDSSATGALIVEYYYSEGIGKILVKYNATQGQIPLLTTLTFTHRYIKY